MLGCGIYSGDEWVSEELINPNCISQRRAARAVAAQSALGTVDRCCWASFSLQPTQTITIDHVGNIYNTFYNVGLKRRGRGVVL